MFDSSRFNICLDITSESGQVEDWFSLVIEAKERWERVIANDSWSSWPASEFDFLADDRIASERPVNGVDDIYIAVFVKSVDGKGKRFAEAGPSKIHTGPRIVSGYVTIDSDDLETALEKNIFMPLMMHEIGHVLGLGTLWDYLGDVKDGSTYIGTSGLDAWHNDIGCSGDLPLASARDTFHWNESCLRYEVMTPTLNYNKPGLFSPVTLGALEDLGYTVNWEEKDEYGLENLGDCGDFCPELKDRRLMLSDTTESMTEPTPELSEEGYSSLLSAAGDHFRHWEEYESSVSYVYEENGHYHSRTIQRSQIEAYL